MLASKKQEWTFSPDYAAKPEAKRQSKPAHGLNVELRKSCCALTVLFLLLAGIATLQTERIVSSGYQCVKLQDDLKTIERENEKLRVEIARLRSLERIQTIAANDLGMIVPVQVLEASPAADGSGRLAAMQQEAPRRKL
ncbi:MAG: cell division protein FtsL [Sporomusaceae bacterium]|nr:cell division protein FtsL [Sporomusaceae bacterium]